VITQCHKVQSLLLEGQELCATHAQSGIDTMNTK